jgi:hypothetical protein
MYDSPEEMAEEAGESDTKGVRSQTRRRWDAPVGVEDIGMVLIRKVGVIGMEEVGGERTRS